MGLFLLDYGAGNVQSLANTLERLGHSFKWISSPADFDDATVSFAISFLLPVASYVYPARRSLSSFLASALFKPLSMA